MCALVCVCSCVSGWVVEGGGVNGHGCMGRGWFFDGCFISVQCTRMNIEYNTCRGLNTGS